MIAGDLILVAFGGIFIASIFMTLGFFRLARQETARENREGLRKNRPFLLALFLCIGAMALTGVSAVRVHDGFVGSELGGSSPLAMAASLMMLWAAWTGFHWAATYDRARWHWRLYLLLATLWTALVLWPRAFD